jgi:hypothetical protein
MHKAGYFGYATTMYKGWAFTALAPRPTVVYCAYATTILIIVPIGALRTLKVKKIFLVFDINISFLFSKIQLERVDVWSPLPLHFSLYFSGHIVSEQNVDIHSTFLRDIFGFHIAPTKRQVF